MSDEDTTEEEHQTPVLVNKASAWEHLKTQYQTDVGEGRKELLNSLIDCVWNADVAAIFHYPVDSSIAPDYQTIITDPIDLSTMRKKVEDQDGYQLLQLMHDFSLMFRNALRYNDARSSIANAARKFRDMVGDVVHEKISTLTRLHWLHMKTKKLNLKGLPPLDIEADNRTQSLKHFVDDVSVALLDGINFLLDNREAYKLQEEGCIAHLLHLVNTWRQHTFSFNLSNLDQLLSQQPQRITNKRKATEGDGEENGSPDSPLLSISVMHKSKSQGSAHNLTNIQPVGFDADSHLPCVEHLAELISTLRWSLPQVMSQVPIGGEKIDRTNPGISRAQSGGRLALPGKKISQYRSTTTNYIWRNVCIVLSIWDVPEPNIDKPEADDQGSEYFSLGLRRGRKRPQSEEEQSEISSKKSGLKHASDVQSQQRDKSSSSERSTSSSSNQHSSSSSSSSSTTSRLARKRRSTRSRKSEDYKSEGRGHTEPNHQRVSPGPPTPTQKKKHRSQPAFKPRALTPDCWKTLADIYIPFSSDLDTNKETVTAHKPLNAAELAMKSLFSMSPLQAKKSQQSAASSPNTGTADVLTNKDVSEEQGVSHNDSTTSPNHWVGNTQDKLPTEQVAATTCSAQKKDDEQCIADASKNGDSAGGSEDAHGKLQGEEGGEDVVKSAEPPSQDTQSQVGTTEPKSERAERQQQIQAASQQPQEEQQVEDENSKTNDNSDQEEETVPEEEAINEDDAAVRNTTKTATMTAEVSGQQVDGEQTDKPGSAPSCAPIVETADSGPNFPHPTSPSCSSPTIPDQGERQHSNKSEEDFDPDYSWQAKLRNNPKMQRYMVKLAALEMQIHTVETDYFSALSGAPSLTNGWAEYVQLLREKRGASSQLFQQQRRPGRPPKNSGKPSPNGSTTSPGSKPQQLNMELKRDRWQGKSSSRLFSNSTLTSVDTIPFCKDNPDMMAAIAEEQYTGTIIDEADPVDTRRYLRDRRNQKRKKNLPPPGLTATERRKCNIISGRRMSHTGSRVSYTPAGAAARTTSATATGQPASHVPTRGPRAFSSSKMNELKREIEVGRHSRASHSPLESRKSKPSAVIVEDTLTANHTTEHQQRERSKRKKRKHKHKEEGLAPGSGSPQPTLDRYFGKKRKHERQCKDRPSQRLDLSQSSTRRKSERKERMLLKRSVSIPTVSGAMTAEPVTPHEDSIATEEQSPTALFTAPTRTRKPKGRPPVSTNTNKSGRTTTQTNTLNLMRASPPPSPKTKPSKKRSRSKWLGSSSSSSLSSSSDNDSSPDSETAPISTFVGKKKSRTNSNSSRSARHSPVQIPSRNTLPGSHPKPKTQGRSRSKYAAGAIKHHKTYTVPSDDEDNTNDIPQEEAPQTTPELQVLEKGLGEVRHGNFNTLDIDWEYHSD